MLNGQNLPERRNALRELRLIRSNRLDSVCRSRTIGGCRFMRFMRFMRALRAPTAFEVVGVNAERASA